MVPTYRCFLVDYYYSNYCSIRKTNDYLSLTLMKTDKTIIRIVLDFTADEMPDKFKKWME